MRSLTSLGPRYMALWVGQTVSQFGTYVAFLTLPFLVGDITGATPENLQTLKFSLTYALETAPALLAGLLVGVLLDRWHLRPIMIATDLLRASAFFYLTATYGNYGVGTVFVIAFIVGSMTTLFDGALYTMIPSLVSGRRLADANSFVSASQQANFAIGTMAAGLIAVATGGPEVGLFINGITFIVSAICLIWVGRVDVHTHQGERSRFLTEAADGIRYLWSEPRLRITTISAAIPNFVIGFVEATIVILFPVVLGTANEAEIGVVVAAMGVGGIIGAVAAPRVIMMLGLGRTMAIGMTMAGCLLFAVFFTHYGVVTLLLSAGWMIGISLINVPLTTIRQHYATPAMLGRVITASRAIGWATLPIGALVGGWLGDSLETLPTVSRVFSLLLVITAAWLFTTVIWSDTFGPHFEGRHTRRKTSPAESTS
ncbi:MAG: MFS transporter [Acidimicrobiia bacterium]